MRRVFVALAALVLLAVVAVAVLVGVVIYAGPRYVRPILERGASAALERPVTIATLDWSWADATVTATGIAVGSAPDQLTAERVLVVVDRAAVSRQHIVIDRVEIDTPGGVLELDERFRPVLGPPRDDDGSAGGAPPSLPIPLTVRTVVVDGGALTVRRATAPGVPSSATLAIKQASASDIEIGGSTTPGLALRAKLDGTLNDAPVAADTTVRWAAAAPDLDATVVVKKVPVQGGLVPLPPPVAPLSGTVDATVTVHFGGSPRQESVQLAARLAGPRLPGLPSGEVAAKSVTVPKARIDLLAHRVDLGPIEVEAPVATVELADERIVLPLPTTAGAPPGEPAWTVRPGRVTVRGGEIRIRRGPAETALQVETARLGEPRDGVAALDMTASAADGGDIAIDGTVNVDRPAAVLTVRAEALTLPPWVQLVDLPVRLSRGQASGTVHLDYRDGLRRLDGDLVLRDVHTVPPEPARPTEVLAVATADLSFTVDGEPSGAVHVPSLRLSYPYVMVLRHAGGTFPLTLLASGGDEPAAAPAEGAQRRPVTVGRVTVEAGKVDFVDATLPAPFWTSLAAVTASAETIAIPRGTVQRFEVAGRRDELSPIDIKGTLGATGLEGRATATDVLLESLSPYVAPLLGYRITSGLLSADATAVPAPPLLESETTVTLRGLDVLQTGTDAILEQSGVPLPIALSLISSPGGKIDLTVPLSFDVRSRTVSVGSIVGQAVRKAIVTALTSPLRILGSLFGTRGAPHAFAVDPIPFPVGSATLDAAGRARIADIARIVQGNRTLLVVLLPQISPEDVGVVGERGAARLAAARNAAARAAFVDGDDGPGLSAKRLLPATWKPADGANATGKPGVYVELQDGE